MSPDSYPLLPHHDHHKHNSVLLGFTGAPGTWLLVQCSPFLLLPCPLSSFAFSNSSLLTLSPDSISLLAHFFPLVSGVYALNSEKKWTNKAIGEKLPECEAGEKPRALGSRPRIGVEGPLLQQVSWIECPRSTSPSYVAFTEHTKAKIRDQGEPQMASGKLSS